MLKVFPYPPFLQRNAFSGNQTYLYTDVSSRSPQLYLFLCSGFSRKKKKEKDNYSKLLKASQIFLQKENVMFFTEIVFKYQKSDIKNFARFPNFILFLFLFSYPTVLLLKGHNNLKYFCSTAILPTQFILKSRSLSNVHLTASTFYFIQQEIDS